MNHFILFGLFGIVILVAIALTIHRWQAEKKRAEALRALAARHGWQYTAKDTRDRDRRWARFEPFHKGERPYCFNILFGREEDGTFEVLDHHYQVTRRTGKTNSTRHYHHKVCILEMPIAAPALSIQDEHLGHKLLDAVGGEDIDFESDTFSRNFWVQCKERRFAYDIIHARTMEFLLETPGWHWQWRGRTLVVYRSGTLDPNAVKAMLGMALRFRRLVPPHRVVAQ